MATPHPPDDVQLICGLLAADPELLDAVADELASAFGAIALRSEVMDFDFTHYYDAEMGRPLHRQFVAFERLVSPETLAEAKRRTNDIEAAFAARAAGRPSRPVNLDPGYLAPSKLVLASMKDFSHRIYLARGVYAEVTLQFRGGKWTALEWTFPDYASRRYDDFLTAARGRLRAPSKARGDT
jgi:hypothetical protein